LSLELPRDAVLPRLESATALSGAPGDSIDCRISLQP
jgi:hypothetical protein